MLQEGHLYQCKSEANGYSPCYLTRVGSMAPTTITVLCVNLVHDYDTETHSGLIRYDHWSTFYSVYHKIIVSLCKQ